MRKLIGATAGLAAALWGSQALAQTAPAPEADPSFWSRVTIEVPVYTHHFPHDRDFNDHNWGAFVDVALTRQWSVEAGDFDNSYRRNTAFVAVGYAPFNWDVSNLRIDVGGMLGLDLNGGYRGHNAINPVLGALVVKVRGNDFTGGSAFLNRLGVAATIIPADPHGGSTAVNLALTWRLQ